MARLKKITPLQRRQLDLRGEIINSLGIPDGYDATTMPIDEAVRKYVEFYDWTTFAELEKVFAAADFDYKGDYALSAGSDPNLIAWAGWSQQAINIVRKLLEDSKLYLYPAQLLTYLADGKALTFPIAKKPPKGGYKSEHWMPVCLRTKPYKEKGARKRRS